VEACVALRRGQRHCARLDHEPARSRAIDRLRFDSRKKRIHGGDEQPPAEVAADPSDVMELREQSESLRAG